VDKVRLNNIQLYGYHGYFKEEREIGQKFEVDIEISTELSKAAESDNLEKTVNYQDVFNEVIDYFKFNRKKLIETVAHDIANKILSKKNVLDIKIIIRKPSVPIGGVCSSVEIELYRTNNE
tara:strand:- start:120 stop:482 length:363 start_codon:yes stop_codon:yes gene_type:complete